MKVWYLLSCTKKFYGPNAHGTPRSYSLLIFFKAKNYQKFGNFWKACIITFQKSNVCNNKKKIKKIFLKKSTFEFTPKNALKSRKQVILI
jgi:hypothetical protein